MKKKTDYRTMFILGIIFTGAGIAIGLPPMMLLGLIFMFVGMIKINRDKWSGDEPDEKKGI